MAGCVGCGGEGRGGRRGGGDEGKDSPFLEYDWLRGLEVTGCATQETGWRPFHLVATMEKRVVAAVPLYLKSHSMGEFIFDQVGARMSRSCMPDENAYASRGRRRRIP